VKSSVTGIATSALSVESPSTMRFITSGTEMLASFAVTRKASASRTRPRNSQR